MLLIGLCTFLFTVTHSFSLELWWNTPVCSCSLNYQNKFILSLSVVIRSFQQLLWVTPGKLNWKSQWSSHQHLLVVYLMMMKMTYLQQQHPKGRYFEIIHLSIIKEKSLSLNDICRLCDGCYINIQDFLKHTIHL